jgi:hypothetical protein
MGGIYCGGLDPCGQQPAIQMTSKIKVKNPDDIEMELTLTMRLKDWKELNLQLQKTWPSWEIGSKIYSMVTHAERHFYPQEQDE